MTRAADNPVVKATIVVVLDGAPDRAWACLQSLAALPEEPAHEVILVDDGSAGLDAIFEAVAGDVEIVRLERRGGTLAALHAALPHVRGEHTALLTEQAAVGAGFLGALLGALQDPALCCATSATAGRSPVAAKALAWRSGELGELPDAPEALAVAALVAALGPARSVEAATAVVAPRTQGFLGSDPELTVVIPTLDAAGDRLRACVAAIQAATGVPHEIVVVDNGAPPQGFTAPVNSGIRAARGRYVVVCNDDVEVLPGWWEPLRATLDAGAAVAFPLTIDGAMREDFAAWCFALGRDTIDSFAAAPGEFLDPRLVVWYQDTDLLARLREAGRPPVLVREARIRHGLSETVGTTDPALRAWIDERIVADRAAFEGLHGASVAGAAR